MKVKTLTFLSFGFLLALLLSYVETLLPVMPVAGMKIGLANVVSLFLLYRDNARHAFYVGFLRVLVSSLLFGTSVSFLYSLAGFLLSFLCMWLLQKKGKLRTVTVSLFGGVFHNLGQIFIAVLLFDSALWSLLPLLLPIGFLSGLFVGILGKLLLTFVPGGVFEKQEK